MRIRIERTFTTTLLLHLIAGLVALALASCRGRRDEGHADPPPPTVLVTTVQKKNVPIYVEHVAQTEAFSTVEIRARVQGFLTQAPFKEGGRVKEGDLLFQIDPQPYQAIVEQTRAQVRRAEVTLARAEADVERLRPLVKQSAISQQDLDDALAVAQVAEADVMGAKAALKKATLDLGYTEMHAPFDGIIGERQVDVGNYVGNMGSATLLATVSTVDPMRAVFHVPEGWFLRYQRRFLGDKDAQERYSVAMPFWLILGDASVYAQDGKFDFADRTLDARAGTLKVVVAFPNEHGLLRPGQFARVRARPEERPGAILVSQRAVVTTQSVRFVYVVGQENKVEQRAIETAEPFESYFVVTKGLAEGEQVIVEGVQKARPGMRVSPMPQNPPSLAEERAEPPPAAAQSDLPKVN